MVVGWRTGLRVVTAGAVTGPGRAQLSRAGDGARAGAGGLAGGGVLGAGDDQVGRGDLEDVAERGEHRQRQPFGGAGDQPVDLGGGQVDAALGQQRRQLGGGEHPAGGHDLAQPPVVADLAAFIGCSRRRGASAAAVPALAGREGGVQGAAQGAGAEVGGHAGVDRGRAGVLVADLLLDEQRVPAVLDQVGDVGAAQRVEVQARVQAEVVAVGGEPGVDPRSPIRAPRSDGHSAGLPCVAEQRPDLGDPLGPGPRPIQAQTVSTLRRFGGEPFIALPYRT